MKTDHNGLIYRCSLCKARAARISEPNSGQCDHDGHRMSETAADYCDQLERENAELKNRVDELERKEYKLKKDNIESLDLLAADTELQNRLADQTESKDKEIAGLQKLVQQMKCCTSCNSRLWAATGKGDCRECKDFDKWTPQQPEAAERGGG